MEAQQDVDQVIDLSNKALNSAQYDEALRLLEPHKDDPRARLQHLRVCRRAQSMSQKELNAGFDTLRQEPLDDQSRQRLLFEDAYSNLTDAMRQWTVGEEVDVSQFDRSIGTFKEWTGGAGSWDKLNMSLYARVAKDVVEAVEGVSPSTHEVARDLVGSLPGFPLRPCMTLLRCSLVANDASGIEKWGAVMWNAFGFPVTSAHPLPPDWQDRSPQGFADALILRGWSLVGSDPKAAIALFDAGMTAIQGVLNYPEIRFWANAASRRCPELA